MGEEGTEEEVSTGRGGAMVEGTKGSAEEDVDEVEVGG